MKKPKRRPERIAMRVVKGVLAPADSTSAARFRARGYHTGDVVFVEVKKPRNPKFYRMAHALGHMLIQNLDEFSEYTDAHSVLKRIQLESGIGCDETAIRAEGLGMVLHRVPRSMSFESMDQGEFKEVYRGLCRHVSQRYWTELNEEQIENMVGVMVGDEDAA